MKAYKIEKDNVDHILRGFLKEKDISHIDMLKMLMQHISLNVTFYNKNKKARELFDKFEDKVLESNLDMEGAFYCFYTSMKFVMEFDDLLSEIVASREKE